MAERHLRHHRESPQEIPGGIHLIATVKYDPDNPSPVIMAADELVEQGFPTMRITDVNGMIRIQTDNRETEDLFSLAVLLSPEMIILEAVLNGNPSDFTPFNKCRWKKETKRRMRALYHENCAHTLKLLADEHDSQGINSHVDRALAQEQKLLAQSFLDNGQVFPTQDETKEEIKVLVKELVSRKVRSFKKAKKAAEGPDGYQ